MRIQRQVQAIKMISKEIILKIFEGFSIQRWTDLLRPFDIVEMDKAAEKTVLAYIIGKYEEHNSKFVDWLWIIYASLFDLLKKSCEAAVTGEILMNLKNKNRNAPLAHDALN